MTKFTDTAALDALLKNARGNASGRPDGTGKGSGDTPGDGTGGGEGDGEQPGEGDDPGEGKSWAEMVEDEFPEGKRLEENLKDITELFKRMLDEMAREEQGSGRVHSLMFVLEIAVETLVADFYAGGYTDVPEVLEEDVFRLRRLVREMGEAFTS